MIKTKSATIVQEIMSEAKDSIFGTDGFKKAIKHPIQHLATYRKELGTSISDKIALLTWAIFLFGTILFLIMLSISSIMGIVSLISYIITPTIMYNIWTIAKTLLVSCLIIGVIAFGNGVINMIISDMH